MTPINHPYIRILRQGRDHLLPWSKLLENLGVYGKSMELLHKVIEFASRLQVKNGWQMLHNLDWRKSKKEDIIPTLRLLSKASIKVWNELVQVAEGLGWTRDNLTWRWFKLISTQRIATNVEEDEEGEEEEEDEISTEVTPAPYEVVFVNDLEEPMSLGLESETNISAGDEVESSPQIDEVESLSFDVAESMEETIEAAEGSGDLDIFSQRDSMNATSEMESEATHMVVVERDGVENLKELEVMFAAELLRLENSPHWNNFLLQVIPFARSFM